MKSIYIPATASEYRSNVLERALPDETLRNNDFYRRLAGWVMDVRTPLLYEQDHDDEYTNFSINFNWLLLRDYSNTKLGPPETIKTMYALHEFTHMTHRLSTRLDTISAEEYAEEFTASEYRASNETEILLHYRVPELRQLVLNGTRTVFDMMRDKGIGQPSSHLLGALRPLAVEHSLLDGFFAGSDEDKAVLARMKGFNGNRQWATERFEAIKPYFSGKKFPQSYGLSNSEYERVISTYEPHLDQKTYQKHVVRNVKFGYAMCGLAVPEIVDFKDALAGAKELENHHAIVQS